MSLTRSQRIRRAFSRAHAYDANATAQAAIAARLVRLTAQAAPPRALAGPTLDMGCGTGGVARLLAPLVGGAYVCADISPAMLDRARTRLRGAPGTVFAASDAASPAFRPGFGLIVSSMALHWTEDPAASVAALWDLLAPGGLLAVAMPGQCTFAPWRQAHADLGLACGLQDFPDAAAFGAMFPAPARVQEHFQPIDMPDGPAWPLALPRHLKAVGGRTPRAGHAPLSPALFRAVLRQLADTPNARARMGYHALFGLAAKPASI